MRDLLSNIKIGSALDAVAADADTNGLDIELAGYDSAVIIVNVGIEGVTLDSSNYIELVLQHAPDNAGSAGTYVDVADVKNVITGSGGETIGADGTWATLDAVADAPGTYSIGYNKLLADTASIPGWIRIQLEFTGTHGTATPIAANYVLGNAQDRPTTNTGSPA